MHVRLRGALINTANVQIYLILSQHSVQICLILSRHSVQIYLILSEHIVQIYLILSQHSVQINLILSQLPFHGFRVCVGNLAVLIKAPPTQVRNSQLTLSTL